jgi:hypothetical protein
VDPAALREAGVAPASLGSINCSMPASSSLVSELADDASSVRVRVERPDVTVAGTQALFACEEPAFLDADDVSKEQPTPTRSQPGHAINKQTPHNLELVIATKRQQSKSEPTGFVYVRRSLCSTAFEMVSLTINLLS